MSEESQSLAVTTVSLQVRRLNARAIAEFADLLVVHEVRDSAPVEIRLHRGQRDQDEGATLIATVVHG